MRISGAIGLDGYMRGPETHILDVMALADPLLARLPAKDMQHWRIGHIERAIPEGYPETLRTGENHITDESIHALLQHAVEGCNRTGMGCGSMAGHLPIDPPPSGVF